MPTREELFTFIRQLLIDNITSISGRVYPAYPVKEVQKPFIVLKTGGKNFPEMAQTNQPISNQLDFEIYIYTSTMKENDSLVEQVENLLWSSDILGTTKTISVEPTIDSLDNMNVIHEGAITLTLEW